MSETKSPDRNLAMELVRVTEAAAMAAARWMGRGDKEGADDAAVNAMRFVLRSVNMDGNSKFGRVFGCRCLWSNISGFIKR